jgi:hypothetical protein
MTAQAPPARSMTRRAPGTFLAGNFGGLTAYVKASRDYGLQRPHHDLFIYRRITVATCIGDIRRVVATENHSRNGWQPSSTHC